MNQQDIDRLLYQIDDFEKKLRDFYIANRKPLPLENIDFKVNTVFYTKQSFFKLDSESPNYENPSIFELKEKNMGTENDVYLLKHPRYLFPFQHQHDFIEMVYIYNGSCRQQINDKIIKIDQGEICIIAPKTKHSIHAFNDESIIINILIKKSTFETAFFGVMLNKDILGDFFTHLLFSKTYYPYLLIRSNSDEKLKEIVLNMLQEQIENDEKSQIVLNCLISLFFANLYRNHKSSINCNADGEKHFSNIASIIHYIHENYMNVSLITLASHFNYSKEYVSHIIKKCTGKNFIDILHIIRMNKAKEFLQNSNLSITEICEAIGYTDATYFTRIFKKTYQLTPSQFRKINKQGY